MTDTLEQQPRICILTSSLVITLDAKMYVVPHASTSATFCTTRARLIRSRLADACVELFCEISLSRKEKWQSITKICIASCGPRPACAQTCAVAKWGEREELRLRVTLSDKQANESCESCDFPSHFSHESVPCGGRHNADSTGNLSLNQITTISSEGEESDLCVTVKFLIGFQAHFH